MSTYKIKEHDSFRIEDEALLKKIDTDEIQFDNPYSNAQKRKHDVLHLGITYDLYKKKDGKPPFQASYYVGADWIDDKHSIAVTPKVENLDYIKLFDIALRMNSKRGQDNFRKHYNIDLESKEIEVDSSMNIATPLLLMHYISTLSTAIGYGLKKGYINKEENLKHIIKGRIKVSQNIRKNILQLRPDHVYCAFQEYTEDIPENRLLKKALIFAKQAINQFPEFNSHTTFLNECNRLLAKFGNVSDDIQIHEIQAIKNNKLFRNYQEALKLAKMVLRHFDYNLDKVNQSATKHTTRPFWIDMSALFEMYVLSILERSFPSQIQYQVEGNKKTRIDYIKKASVKDPEILFIDAKYKPDYSEKKHLPLDDLREVSGYARDKTLLNKVILNSSTCSIIPANLCSYEKYCSKINSKDSSKTLSTIHQHWNDKFAIVPKCLFIYPDIKKSTYTEITLTAPLIQDKKPDKETPEFQQYCEPDNDFEEFYKLGIPMPIMRE